MRYYFTEVSTIKVPFALQLKARVSPNLPYEYMKEEVYLIRWLRGMIANQVS